MRVERYSSLNSTGLETAWNQLHAGVPQAGLFTSYDWCRCWLETAGTNHAPCVLVMRAGDGAPLGLAPLCLELHRGTRWLKFMGRERVSGDHLDVIAHPENRAAVLDAMLRELRRLQGECDGLVLGELEPGSVTQTELTDWARHKGYSWYEREHRRVPYIDLPESFEAMLGRLSANMRYHVRRRRRGMEKTRGAEIELVRSGPALHDRLEEFFQLHARRWRLEGLPGNFTDRDMQSFLHRICSRAAERDMLRVFTLRLAGSTQAVLICFHHPGLDGGTANYYQMGWAPDCPIESPGVILLSHSIEHAIAEGLVRYDFLRGDEAYKSRWTETFAEQTTLVVGWSWSARASIAADKLKNHVKSAVSNCLGPSAWERARRLAGSAQRTALEPSKQPVSAGEIIP